jgi:hypothetical protein
MGRRHATVCHTAGEWARDDDGDGIREVHDNTLAWISTEGKLANKSARNGSGTPGISAFFSIGLVIARRER